MNQSLSWMGHPTKAVTWETLKRSSWLSRETVLTLDVTIDTLISAALNALIFSMPAVLGLP